MYHYEEVYFSFKLLLAENATDCNNLKLTVSVLVSAARVKPVYKKLENMWLQHTHVYKEDSLKNTIYIWGTENIKNKIDWQEQGWSEVGNHFRISLWF